MDNNDLQDLSRRGLALLRLSAAEWAALAATRRQGGRFSLHFDHGSARQVRRGQLVLVAAPRPDPMLRLGLISSVSATSTFDTRVLFELVSPVAPGSLTSLLAAVTTPSLKSAKTKLAKDHPGLSPVSDKLGQALLHEVAADPDNSPALVRILAHLRRPTRFDNARALQADALSMAVKAFGGDGEATELLLPGGDTALATARLHEDAIIEHDARWMPGWRLDQSDLTGRATFKRRDERLEVFTANKRPLEELFGVDLIYLNERRGALVMVQYKMLEPGGPIRASIMDEEDEDDNGRDLIVRIDDQFKDELDRMRRFDRDLDPTGAYRLNSGAFYFKFVRRQAAARSAGIVVSLGHFEQLLAEGGLTGPRGGLRLSYDALDGHYLRGGAFVELVRSAYVGTRGATTDHLRSMIEASLAGGRGVVAALQTGLGEG
jgi:hypothetical protein